MSTKSTSFVQGCSIYRRGGRKGKGKWQVAWTDPTNPECKRTVRSVSHDFDVTIEWAKREMEAVERRRLGLPPVRHSPTATPIPELVTSYFNLVLSGGPSRGHALDEKRHVETICCLANFNVPEEIDATKVQLVLGAMTGKVSMPDAHIDLSKLPRHIARRVWRRLSHRTANAYLSTMNRFAEWLEGGSHIAKNPLRRIKPFNEKLDRIHEREGLRRADLLRLIDMTATAPDVYDVPGRDRAGLYFAAAVTGLRSDALRRLQIWQFSLDSLQPGVRELISQEKGKKERFVPLRRDEAAWLAMYLAGKRPEELAFRMPSRTNVARMLREDLKRAGLTYCETSIGEDGVKRRARVHDFHSLKGSYATRLVLEAGADRKVLQDLVGHSTAELTFERYVHTVPQDSVDALQRLTPLSAAPLQRTA